MSTIDNAVKKKKASQNAAKVSMENRFKDRFKNFSLNLRALKKNGFFVPSDKPQRLAQELRVIKRRLLRKIKFYKVEKTGIPNAVKPEDHKNVVLVTSTSPAEGKTFTSVNLALSLALEDKINVLLIDADVPRPRVFEHLGVGDQRGITDKMLNPQTKLTEMIITETQASLSLLSQGTQKMQVSDLYARSDFADLISQLSDIFHDHIIIIDAPPILAAPGTSLLANYVDEVVFVVRANQTPEPAVIAAIDEIMEINPEVSLVLNDCLVPGKYSHYGSYDEYYYKADKGRG